MNCKFGTVANLASNRARFSAVRVVILVCVMFTAWGVSSFVEVTRPEEKGKRAGFTKLDAAETGILFTNQIAEIRALTNRNLLSGSGVALGDVDGDGLCDIYFAALDNDNVLYRNRGNWRFEAVEAANLGCPNQDSTGAVFADVEGDGDLDLLVTGLGTGVRLFANDGKGRFTERTAEAGLESRTGAMSMALADIEGDGDLDLYVVNYRPTTIKDLPTAQFRVEYIGGKPTITQLNGVPTTRPDLTNRFVLSPTGQVMELGEADHLYINNGNGTFRQEPFTRGRFKDEEGKVLTAAPMDWGLAAIFYDFTSDGAPDLYVCNDLFPPDRIWINDGKGNFRAIAHTAIRSTSTFSMGVDFADIDRDGWPDFFVTDMRSRDHTHQQVQVGEMSSMVTPPGFVELRQQKGQNTLQRNRGDGTFAEISMYAGVEGSEWSWGPIFLDVDLDGWEDLLISNGNQYDVQNADVASEIEGLKAANRLTHRELLELLRKFPKLTSQNLIFRNQRDLTFNDTSNEWGFRGEEISQGMALGDLDNDGDLDLVINNLYVGAGVYRNDAAGGRVAVRLRGAGGNTQGVGAKIELSGGPVLQRQEILGGGRYLSSDDAVRVFALPGNAMGEITVTWRNGKRTQVKEVRPNRIYTVEEQR